MQRPDDGPGGPRSVVRLQSAAVGRVDEGPRRGRVLRRRRLPRGRGQVRPYAIEALGDVTGKTLLHLQCHFGLDTLSWARLGAMVTGVDFSPAAIGLARELAADIGFPDARFVESNIYQLPLRGSATSSTSSTPHAASSGWLPDIRGWAGSSLGSSSRAAGFYITRGPPGPPGRSRTRASRRASCGSRYPYWEHGDPLDLRRPRVVRRPDAPT